METESFGLPEDCMKQGSTGHLAKTLARKELCDGSVEFLTYLHKNACFPVTQRLVENNQNDLQRSASATPTQGLAVPS